MQSRIRLIEFARLSLWNIAATVFVAKRQWLEKEEKNTFNTGAPALEVKFNDNKAIPKLRNVEARGNKNESIYNNMELHQWNSFE